MPDGAVKSHEFLAVNRVKEGQKQVQGQGQIDDCPAQHSTCLYDSLTECVTLCVTLCVITTLPSSQLSPGW